MVHETVGVREARAEHRLDPEHARRATREVLRQRGERADAPLHGLRLPRIQHPRPGDVHPGPPRHGGRHEDDYVLIDGETLCSTAIGWNFGDGHMHNKQLVAALQKRCRFERGEVRIALIDGQPIHRQHQRYRLVDAATGEFETGYLNVADMVIRQPWDDDVPVHIDVPTGSPAR